MTETVTLIGALGDPFQVSADRVTQVPGGIVLYDDGSGYDDESFSMGPHPGVFTGMMSSRSAGGASTPSRRQPRPAQSPRNHFRPTTKSASASETRRKPGPRESSAA